MILAIVNGFMFGMILGLGVFLGIIWKIMQGKSATYRAICRDLKRWEQLKRDGELDEYTTTGPPASGTRNPPT